jgi:hypothetical protein
VLKLLLKPVIFGALLLPVLVSAAAWFRSYCVYDGIVARGVYATKPHGGREKVHVADIMDIVGKTGSLRVETFSRRMESGRGRFLLSSSRTSFVMTAGRQSQGYDDEQADFTDNGWESDWQTSHQIIAPRLVAAPTGLRREFEFDFHSGSRKQVDFVYFALSMPYWGATFCGLVPFLVVLTGYHVRKRRLRRQLVEGRAFEVSVAGREESSKQDLTGD